MGYTAYSITEMILDETLVSSQATLAANKVLDGLKRWGGFQVGAHALALELRLPEPYVAKVMYVIARQGFLVPGAVAGIYGFKGARFRIQDASHINDKGFVLLKSPQDVENRTSDVWGRTGFH